MVIAQFKVTDFGTNRKPICDFLLAINTNLHPISHRFQVIADYWSYFRFNREGVPLFNTLVRGEPINSRRRNLASSNLKYRLCVRCKTHFSIFSRLGVDGRTDQPTDGQTDRWPLAIARSIISIPTRHICGEYRYW